MIRSISILFLMIALNAMMNGCMVGPSELTSRGFAYFQEEQYEEAMKWYHKAADRNYPYGYYQVGRMYELGAGCEEKPDYYF